VRNLGLFDKGILVAGSSNVFRWLFDIILTDLHYCHKVRGDGWNQTQDLFNTMLVYTNNDTEVLPVVVRRKFYVLVTFPEDAIWHS
jgi:hypothetical protein